MKRILVVDDSADLRRIFIELLSPLGYDILVAANGIEALNKLLDNSVDLVISDIRMPFMDGEVLCQKIREHDRGIKIILMSGQRPTGKGGVPDYFVQKPFDCECITNLVRVILGN